MIPKIIRKSYQNLIIKNHFPTFKAVSGSEVNLYPYDIIETKYKNQISLSLILF